MHSGDVTREQADKLLERIRPMFHYLSKLQKRMEERGFCDADRLLQQVKAARYALQLLEGDLQRIRCGPSFPGYNKS
jgi:hypothetical protein